MGSLRADLKHAGRANLKRWPSSAVIVLLLGGGIGAAVAMLNVNDAMTRRPLPFTQPERLVGVCETQSHKGRYTEEASWPTYLEWRRGDGPFAQLGAFRTAHFNVGGGRGEPENLQGTFITPGLFPLLGVTPLMGRTFVEQESFPGRNLAVLVSYALWQTRLLEDPNAVGGTLMVDGVPRTIVGVMPPRFAFPKLAQLWMPLVVDESRARWDDRSYDVVARLKAGVTSEQAQARMEASQARIAQLHPDSNAGWGVRVWPLKKLLLPAAVQAGTGLGSCAGVLILAITCANVGLLLLARFQARSKEGAVRLALGATRAGLTRRFLLECLWLAAVGGLVGVPLSILATRLTVMAVPNRIPYWLDFDVKPITFVFAAVITSAAAMMAGLLPALRSARFSLADALKDETRAATAGGRGVRLRHLFAIGQVAMSFALLTSALLVTFSYVKLQAFDRGFDERQLLTMRFVLRGDAYRDEQARLHLVQDVLRNAQALPGVVQAAVTSSLPLRSDVDEGVAIEVEGRPVTPGEEDESQWRAVSAGYFDTFRIPVLRGRSFTAAEEQEGARVVLVSDTLARRLWTNDDALGRRLRVAGSDGWWQVIGVTGSVRRAYRMAGLGHAAADRQVYVPQSSYDGRTWWLAVRSDPSRSAVPIAAVKSALGRVDRELPFFDVASMEEVIREAEWLPLLWTRMFVAFSLMGLALTALGTYGIASHSVGQRTHEIGVRMALGASTSKVTGLVLERALRLAAAGTVVGLALSAVAAPLMRALLQDVSALDPLILAVATATLALTSVVAASIPAWRAARVDPMVALRCE